MHSSIIYEFPVLQRLLNILTYDQIVSGIGPLGWAGTAYMSGNVFYAAAVTFVVNLSVGALLSVTLPSLLVPGAAVPIACFRSVLWGVLLAPVGADLARSMLPHSFTLWLEVEAYILGTIFGLLLPMGLFRPQPGQTVGRRYLRAIGLNFKGLLWCAIILLLAAIYEAVEILLIVSKG